MDERYDARIRDSSLSPDDFDECPLLFSIRRGQLLPGGLYSQVLCQSVKDGGLVLEKKLYSIQNTMYIFQDR